MTEPNEQAIREQAYALWEKEGYPDGRDVEFWERARLMLAAAAAPPPATSTPISAEERAEDVALRDTFPASDPPSFTPGTSLGTA